MNSGYPECAHFGNIQAGDFDFRSNAIGATFESGDEHESQQSGARAFTTQTMMAMI